ncbi:MAG: ATP-binding protein [Deltaproteobacteria bacterium]|nr:ATP-binding protein [Deltaproteobacteria bacterium]
MNPFKYGTIVSGKDFCGRESLLKQIIGYIESSQRIALLGERRVGKSSAVYEAVLKSRKARLLYVDLMGIKSIDVLCRRILRAIIILEQKTKWFDKILKNLSYLRPSISVDPLTSMPTVLFDASVEIRANSIPEVLSLVESLGEKRRLVAVFDEFQDILNLEDPHEALALLRSGIQFQNRIPYIFVGSIRHKMDEIFTHHDSAFFKSAIPLTVEPLPYDEFSKFLRKKFSTGQRRIDEMVLKRVFEIANNITGDVQQLCEALWEVTSEKEVVSEDRLKKSLDLIFSREQKSYENYVNLLTDIQLRCLMAIAREGGRGVFSVSFMKAAGFNNPSTVRRAITRLMNLNILFESEGEYKFINPFFRAWLPYKG